MWHSKCKVELPVPNSENANFALFDRLPSSFFFGNTWFQRYLLNSLRTSSKHVSVSVTLGDTVTVCVYPMVWNQVWKGKNPLPTPFTFGFQNKSFSFKDLCNLRHKAQIPRFSPLSVSQEILASWEDIISSLRIVLYFGFFILLKFRSSQLYRYR